MLQTWKNATLKTISYVLGDFRGAWAWLFMPYILQTEIMFTVPVTCQYNVNVLHSCISFISNDAA